MGYPYDLGNPQIYLCHASLPYFDPPVSSPTDQAEEMLNAAEAEVEKTKEAWQGSGAAGRNR